MRFRGWIIGLVPMAGLMAAFGCTHPRSGTPRPQSQRQQFERSEPTRFASAVLYKPRPSNWEALPVKLAPLFVIEAGSSRSLSSALDNFEGAFSGRGDPTGAVVGAQTGLIQFGNLVYQDARFAWQSPGSRKSSTAPAVRGLRIIVDPAGRPIVWEVLSAGARSHRLFVARSLEQAAAAEFGDPLPGRRYAIEQSLAAAPEVVVAGTLDDGPIPMGPMIYLSGATGEITTVLCRCSPAQVVQIKDTREFELYPVEEMIEAVDSAAGSRTRAEGILLSHRLTAAELSSVLRWPRG